MLAPQGSQQAAPQLPQGFGGGQAQQMQAPMQQGGKPAKPVLRGLVTSEEIDDRLSSMPRAAQEYVKRAIATLGEDLPQLMGVIIGPEAHDYFELALNAMKQAAQQQNSQGAAPADASQNPQAPAPDAAAGGQPPAMATPGQASVA